MFKHFVYIIYGINSSNKKKYYIGYTNNPQRRIRQHNREIVGGAKSTIGYKWKYCGIITNFRDKIEGLQIEWRLKYSTKKTNIINRINSFINYINVHLKASPNNIQMVNKLIIYINLLYLPLYLPKSKHIIIQSKNIILINIIISKEILNHIQY